MARLVVPRCGQLTSTGDLGEPYRLIDADGAVVEPVSAFLRELLAAGRSPATLRSYGMDLLRWWRFRGAVHADWRRASRIGARDFSYDTLNARIAEAQREGWLGEVEGLQVSLARAEDKLAQVDRRQHPKRPAELGIPTVTNDH